MAMGGLWAFITVLDTLSSTTPHVLPTQSTLCCWHELGLTFPSNPMAPQGLTDVLSEVQHTELGFLSKLPLALGICIV